MRLETLGPPGPAESDGALGGLSQGTEQTRTPLQGSAAGGYALQMLQLTAYISLGFAIFNLIPIPPLDGFHVLEELLPYKLKMTEGYHKFEMFAPYGIWVLFILSYSSGLNVLSTVISWIELPFSLVITGACTLIAQLF